MVTGRGPKVGRCVDEHCGRSGKGTPPISLDWSILRVPPWIPKRLPPGDPAIPSPAFNSRPSGSGCPLAFSRGRCWIEYFQGFTQVKQINVRQRERVEDPLDDGFYRDGRGPVADGEAGRQLVKAMALVCTPRKPSRSKSKKPGTHCHVGNPYARSPESHRTPGDRSAFSSR